LRKLTIAFVFVIFTICANVSLAKSCHPDRIEKPKMPMTEILLHDIGSINSDLVEPLRKKDFLMNDEISSFQLEGWKIPNNVFAKVFFNVNLVDEKSSETVKFQLVCHKVHTIKEIRSDCSEAIEDTDYPLDLYMLSEETGKYSTRVPLASEKKRDGLTEKQEKLLVDKCEEMSAIVNERVERIIWVNKLEIPEIE